ncbi:MAG: hypothetical protein N2Z76_05605, partial [Treponemataceae bacterium]|nr:hypothetical protein [Treponemataceae bacterium]
MDLKDKWKLDEEGFHLYIPQRRRPWYNYLSNGAVGLKISHLGDGFSTTLREPRITISNYDFWAPLKGRFVYITDGDVIWNPSFHPSGTALDSYKCSHTPWSTYWIASKNGIEVECTIFLPRQGPMEVLLVTVWNHSEKERSLYLTTLEEFLLYNSFGVDPVYFSWFTDTVMDPSGKTLWLRKNVGAQVMGFYHSGEKPSSYQGSLKQLIAEGTISFPQEIVKPPLSNTMSGGDPYVGAFQWFLTLPPRGTHTLAVVSGVVPLENTSAVQDSKEWENIKRLVPSEMLYQMEYLGDPEGAKEELAAVKSLWKKKVDRSWYVSLPKGIFSFWLRTFFGAQMYQQSTGMVRSTFRGFRDVAQDVMGLCRFEPGVARNILIDLCSHQYLSGRCVRQWNTEGGPADERDFRDLPLWIPVALATYERLCGDPSIWDEEAPYLDSSQKETLLEHSLRGFQYVLQYGDHGLLYICL